MALALLPSAVTHPLMEATSSALSGSMAEKLGLCIKAVMSVGVSMLAPDVSTVVAIIRAYASLIRPVASSIHAMDSKLSNAGSISSHKRSWSAPYSSVLLYSS